MGDIYVSIEDKEEIDGVNITSQVVCNPHQSELTKAKADEQDFIRDRDSRLILHFPTKIFLV